ncbi:MAG: DUF5591 domain-containing protein, partial [Candidatus Thorarchaeota archaeon]
SHSFDNPEVIDFTQSVIETWMPSKKPILFVPCSKHKPIQESLSHKQMFHRFRDKLDLLILSEPLTIIPYDRFDYPDYDYPPYALWRIEGESDKFKDRLTTFLEIKKLNNYYCFFFTPHHHLMVLWPAWKRAFGDISGLRGYSYTQATRWFFLQKLEQDLSGFYDGV